MTAGKTSDGDTSRRSRGVAGGLIPDWLDAWFTRSVAPIIRRLILARVNPNAITVAAFVLTAAGGACIAGGWLLTAVALIVVGGILDFSDGKVAALTGRVTVFGGILDSVLDRYADAAVYLGLAVYFARGGHAFTALAALIALVGSMTTSYLVAIGRAHGFAFRSGLLRRQDRVTLIAGALALSTLHGVLAAWVSSGAAALGVVMPRIATLPVAPVVWLLALLTNVTALQRLGALRRLANRGPDALDAGESLRQRQLGMLRATIGRVTGEGRPS